MKLFIAFVALLVILLLSSCATTTIYSSDFCNGNYILVPQSFIDKVKEEDEDIYWILTDNNQAYFSLCVPESDLPR